MVQGVAYERTPECLRIKTNADHRIDIQIPLDPDSTSIPVRLRINDLDPKKRNAKQKAVVHFFEKELAGILCGIEEFEEIGEADAWFFYDTKILLDPDLKFHETVMIGGTPEIDAHNDAPAMAEDDGVIEYDGEITIEEPENKGIGALTRAPEVVYQAEILVNKVEDDNDDDNYSLARRAVREFETVDAKMLRQSLDMMSLRRSSNVRLALTRIFRNALDEASLLLAVEEEAPKIVSKEDIEELKVITSISSVGFMKPLIELLYREVFGVESG